MTHALYLGHDALGKGVGKANRTRPCSSHTEKLRAPGAPLLARVGNKRGETSR